MFNFSKKNFALVAFFLSISANAESEKVKACREGEIRPKGIIEICERASKDPNLTVEKIRACNQVSVIGPTYQTCIYAAQNFNVTTDKIKECAGSMKTVAALSQCLNKPRLESTVKSTDQAAGEAH